MIRRFAALFGLVLLAVAAGGAGQPPPPAEAAHLSQADLADLDKVSEYLNSIHTLQGDFVQIDPNGDTDQGRFYLAKPGRLRFEYDPPSPLLIVSDGRFVSVANTKLKHVDRYPLSATPLDLIVGDNIDLRHSKEILAVEHQSDTLIILARTSTNRTKANLRLEFTYPIIELREWTVLDDQGLKTTVALRGLEQGVALNDSLFVMRDLRKPIGTRSGE
ncbi:MAG: outer-membrane lipoprotein carrier protein LolA [Alphaproteobacteria bacterium]|nr:outer-membrane lipoprotein carrier protein LolA [Alphaproteobacteria bacterium]